MTKIIKHLMMLGLLLSSQAALAWGGSPWGNNGWDDNDWPKWTPMYWMEEFFNNDDDDLKNLYRYQMLSGTAYPYNQASMLRYYALQQQMLPYMNRGSLDTLLPLNYAQRMSPWAMQSPLSNSPMSNLWSSGGFPLSGRNMLPGMGSMYPGMSMMGMNGMNPMSSSMLPMGMSPMSPYMLGASPMNPLAMNPLSMSKMSMNPLSMNPLSMNPLSMNPLSTNPMSMSAIPGMNAFSYFPRF
jgi:hypothetical protein